MIGLSLSLSLGNSSGAAVAPAPSYVTQNAVAIRVPGDDATNETTVPTSAGSPITSNADLTNLSGASITDLSLIFIGWVHAAAGTTAVGNDVPTTATIEYPAGTTVGTIQVSASSSFTVTNNTTVTTDVCALSTPIPVGASFRVVSVSTVANGSKYAIRNGLAAVLSKTLSTVPRVSPVMWGSGDSMIALNGGVWLRGFEKSCPIMQAAIFGTTALTYSTGSNFTKQIALMVAAGVTDFISNWSINDISAGASAATLQTRVTTIKNAVAAAGITCHWATLNTSLANANYATGAVGTMTANNMLRVPITAGDETKFVVGAVMTITEAATQSSPVPFSELFAIVRSIDAVGHTVTFEIPDKSGTGRISGQVGTGNITLAARLGSTTGGFTAGRSTLTPGLPAYATFNTFVRTPGSFTSYIDLSATAQIDATDSGYYATQQQVSGLAYSRQVTVTAVGSTTQVTMDGGPYGTQAFVDLMWLTGPNAGTISTGSGSGQNAGNVFLFSSATGTLPTVGDTAWARFTWNTAITYTDGLHFSPIADGMTGGSANAQRAVKAWATTKLNGVVAIPINTSGGTPYFYDSMKRLDSSASVPLSGNVQITDSGHIWLQRYRTSVNSAGFFRFAAGRGFCNTGGAFRAIAEIAAPSLDGFAEAEFYCWSTASNTPELYLHCQLDSFLGYSWRYDRTNTRWGLFRTSAAGADTQIGSYYTDAFSAGTKRTVRIVRSGTTITGYLDIDDGNGMLSRASGTDASATITVPGRHGCSVAVSTSTTGVHWSNFRAV